MEYIKQVDIEEAVIHILDSNGDKPVLNEYKVDLNEETYKFILKHIERCLKDEELKYAKFNAENNTIKALSQEYLNGEKDIITVSKDMAGQLFDLMKSNTNIPSCDLIVVSFTTEYGRMFGMLKMDYVKNYTHSVDFVENKVGIKIIPELTGLPVSSQKIQKCAFIKMIQEDSNFDLMVIDKQNKGKNKDEEDSYDTNYFVNRYLKCSLISNERDETKTLLKAVEDWTRTNLSDDADNAEVVRSTVKRKLKDEDYIDLNNLTHELFSNESLNEKDKMLNGTARQNFKEYVTSQGVSESINVDKEYVDKKLKRTRLKIDKDIDIYVNQETYNDNQRFEIQRNGDGSINIVIKHVINYIEK